MNENDDDEQQLLGNGDNVLMSRAKRSIVMRNQGRKVEMMSR
jgi:hypothetical protein